MSRLALLGAGLLAVGAVGMSQAQALANKRGSQEANVIAFGFRDDSLFIADTVTPANNYNGKMSTSGKITFARASLAMQAISDGRWVYAPHNLLLYSEQFDNAAWTKSNLTVSANATTDPRGGSNADSLVENTSASAYHNANQAITKIGANQTFYAAISVKANGRNANINVQQTGGVNGCGVLVNLTAGTIGAPYTYGTGFTVTSAQVQSEGSGWYRVIIEGVSNTDTTLMLQCALNHPTGGLSTYTGDGTSGVYVFAADLKITPVLNYDYFTTTSAAYHGPRFGHYDPATLQERGYLNENLQTNFALYSNDKTQAAHTKTNCSVAASTQDDIIAGVKMQAIIEDTANTTHDLNQSWAKSAANVLYTFSKVLKLKDAARNEIVIHLHDGAGNGVNARFNIATGTISSAIAAYGTGFTAHGAYMINQQDGRWRCVLAFTSNTATLIASTIRPFVGSGSYLGDGVSGYYSGHMQFEANTLTATSPIMCAANAISRQPDQFRVANSVFNIGSSRRSIYMKGALALRHGAADSINTSIPFFIASAAGWNECAYIVRPVSQGHIGWAVADGGVGQFTGSSLVPYTPDVSFTNAARLEQDNYASQFNSNALAEDISGTVPETSTYLAIGSSYAASTYGNYWIGTIDELAFVPRSWANDEILVMNGNVRALYPDSFVYANHEDITAAGTGTGPWTYAYATKDIGAPDLRRRVYVEVLAHGGTNTTVDSFTANDAHGNVIAFTRTGHAALGASAIGIFRSTNPVTVGRTLVSPVATIGGSAAPARTNINVWSVGRSHDPATPIEVTDTGVLSTSGTINIPAGGAAIGAVMTTTDLVTHTWNVGVEDWDEKLSATTMSSGMHYANAGGAETGKTITVTFSASANNTRLVVVPLGAQVA